MLVAKKYHRYFLYSLAAILAMCFFAALAIGSVAIPVHRLLDLFTGNVDAHVKLIVIELRLPRAILCLSIGAMLATSGAVMQGLFRNPLADPSLIGVTAGASLGASLVIFFGLSFSQLQNTFIDFHTSAIILGASSGGAVSVYLIYLLATRGRVTSVVTMLLAGIALTALVGGISNLLSYFSDNDTLRRISLWHMGSLDGANSSNAVVSLFLLAIIFSIMVYYAQTLNVFLFGESEARHLGVNVEKAKKVFIFIVAIATGFSVALAGSIAFVGLVVPHIVRIFVGPDHRYLIPGSALGGAILLLVSDILARILIAPSELPIGLLTTLVGAPFFIGLLIKSHRNSTMF